MGPLERHGVSGRQKILQDASQSLKLAVVEKVELCHFSDNVRAPGAGLQHGVELVRRGVNCAILEKRFVCG